MTTKKSIFFEEWRACLQAHYRYVLREGDSVTEPTLRDVLRHAGMSDDALIATQAAALGTPAHNEADAARDAPADKAADRAETAQAADVAPHDDVADNDGAPYDEAPYDEADYDHMPYTDDDAHNPPEADDAWTGQDDPGDIPGPDDDEPPPPPDHSQQLSLF